MKLHLINTHRLPYSTQNSIVVCIKSVLKGNVSCPIDWLVGWLTTIDIRLFQGCPSLFLICICFVLPLLGFIWILSVMFVG